LAHLLCSTASLHVIFLAKMTTGGATQTYDAQASTNYKEAFALFDKRGNGRVQLDSLGDLLRACGQNPTLAEIRELEKNVGSDCEYIQAV
jgi:Ca2+-binding EF-hand superfamily protein